MTFKDEIKFFDKNRAKEVFAMDYDSAMQYFQSDEIMRMYNYDQNNCNHQYNLWDHTYHVIENAPDNNLMAIAGLLHDIGKPLTQGVNKKCGEYTFYNHAFKSANIAERLLTEWGIEGEDKQYVLDLVKYHDSFINYTKDKSENPNFKEINENNLTELCQKIGRGPDFLCDLIDFCDADIKAQSVEAWRTFADGTTKCIGTMEEKLDKNQAIRELAMKMAEKEHLFDRQKRS